MNHPAYQNLTWREKNERIGKLVHLFQNSETAFNEMNILIKAADAIDYFQDVEFFPTTIPAPDTHIASNTNKD